MEYQVKSRKCQFQSCSSKISSPSNSQYKLKVPMLCHVTDVSTFGVIRDRVLGEAFQKKEMVQVLGESRKHLRNSTEM